MAVKLNKYCYKIKILFVGVVTVAFLNSPDKHLLLLVLTKHFCKRSSFGLTLEVSYNQFTRNVRG